MWLLVNLVTPENSKLKSEWVLEIQCLQLLAGHKDLQLKCAFNVGFGQRGKFLQCGRENLLKSVMVSPTLQDFPHRPIDWPGHTQKIFVYFFSVHTHTHTHRAQVATRWWQQFNNQTNGDHSQWLQHIRKVHNLHSCSCSNCRLMDYWWKKMSGIIFHPSPMTFRIGCLCQCSNSQQTRYGQMDVTTIPSGILAELGFFFLLTAPTSKAFPTTSSFFKVQHCPRLSPGHISTFNIRTYGPSYANSLPTSTLKLTVGIFWEGVVFGFWAFWTGIAVALYNMDWSLKSFPFIRTH
jgi:hypothetical protein